jgi:hypothetical protein
VGPGLTSAGFLAVPNINYDCWEACWRDYLQFASGAAREWWTKNGYASTGHYADSGWEWSTNFLRITQEAGKFLLPITYAPAGDTRSMRYARASFLLHWDGGRSAMVFEPMNPEAQDPYSPEWTVDVGLPVGARYRVGAAWRRDYTGGTVLVNPSSTTAQFVSLGAAYLADGTAVTRVTLQPATGLVLRVAPSPPPPNAGSSPPPVQPAPPVPAGSTPAPKPPAPARKKPRWQKCSSPRLLVASRTKPFAALACSFRRSRGK